MFLMLIYLSYLHLLLFPSFTLHLVSGQGWADDDDDGFLNDVPSRFRPPPPGHPSTHGVDGDELIISGDGANCYDDEDCTPYTTEANSDDLITPRLMLVSPRPPYTPLEHGFRTSTAKPPFACDDEDCDGPSGDGSDDDDDDDDGDGEGDPTRKGSSSKTGISYSWPGMRTPSPTPYYARTPLPTPYEDKSIMFTSKPIPPSGNDIQLFTELQPKRVTPPPRPTGPRVIVDVPKPERPLTFPHFHHGSGAKNITIIGPHGQQLPTHHRQPPTVPLTHSGHPQQSHHPTHHHHSSTGVGRHLFPNWTFIKSGDRTALVIIVIAVIIIVIVIVAGIFVFVRVKYRPLPSGPLMMMSPSLSAIDNRKNYTGQLPVPSHSLFNPVSGTPQLLMPAGHHPGHQPPSSVSVTHLNGSGGPPLPGDYKSQQTPLLPKKDLKEWYV